MHTYVFFWYGFLVWLFINFCYMAFKISRRPLKAISLPSPDYHMSQLYFDHGKRLEAKYHEMLVLPYEEWPKDLRDSIENLKKDDLPAVANTLMSIAIHSDKRIWSKRRLEIDDKVKAQEPNSWWALEEFNKELSNIKKEMDYAMESAVAYANPLIPAIKSKIVMAMQNAGITEVQWEEIGGKQ